MKIVGSLPANQHDQVLVGFPIAFDAEPTFSVSFQMETEPGVEVMPVATFCSITAWQRDGDGHVAGAWIQAGIVWSSDEPPPPSSSFHYEFEGTAA